MRTLLLGFLLLAGCRYHFQDSEHLYQAGDTITVNVPYINGDKEGELNTALTLAIAETGCFEYRQDHATLELTVDVISDEGTVIGYRYDRNPTTGVLRPNILSTENRRTITVCVKLVDLRTDTVVVGPVNVSASSDFDYVQTSSIKDLTFTPPGGKPQTVIDFSLGQLDAIDGANDDVRRPIYRALSQKIVSSILGSYPKEQTK